MSLFDSLPDRQYGDFQSRPVLRRWTLKTFWRGVRAHWRLLPKTLNGYPRDTQVLPDYAGQIAALKGQPKTRVESRAA